MDLIALIGFNIFWVCSVWKGKQMLSHSVALRSSDCWNWVDQDPCSQKWSPFQSETKVTGRLPGFSLFNSWASKLEYRSWKSAQVQSSCGNCVFIFYRLPKCVSYNTLEKVRSPALSTGRMRVLEAHCRVFCTMSGKTVMTSHAYIWQNFLDYTLPNEQSNADLVTWTITVWRC